MKTQNLLRLSFLSLVSLAACAPTAEPNKSASPRKVSPGIPMTNSTPSMPSAPTVPMVPMVPKKRKSGADTVNIPILQESMVAPDFVSMDIAGKSVYLADFKDNVVVLDFWATWCGPCLASLPHTQEVANRYKDQGVVTLAVCTSDARAKFETWASANQAKYPDIVFTCDPNERDAATFDERASRKLYGVGGIPTQFVIGRDGKIVAVLVGASNGDVRLEAGLARAGIAVDLAVAAQGEEQFKDGVK